MTSNYVISQVFVVFAVVALGFSYLVKDKKKITVLCVLCSLFYGIEYLLLGAFTGVAMNVVSILRNVWFYKNACKGKKNNLFTLMFFCVLIVVVGTFSYQNIYSIIPIIATLMFTFTLWQDNIKVYRWISLPMSALWITYNICIYSIFGVIAELIVLVFEIVGVIRVIVKNGAEEKLGQNENISKM